MGAGGGSIQLFKILGIRIGASPSWFVVLFVMVYLLAGQFQGVVGITQGEAFALAVGGALAFFLSIVLHELGHALAARRLGIGITGIDLWFFGGWAKMSRDTATPREELEVSAAGPLVTLLIVAACFVVSVLTAETGGFVDAATFRIDAASPGLLLLGFVGFANVLLLVFNLIPAFPLDGGRIARAAAWKATGDKHRATRLSGRVGVGFAYVLAALGVVVALRGDLFDGLWLVVLAYFLGQGARAAVVSSDVVSRLDGVTASDLMDANPVTVAADTPAAEARDSAFDRYDWPWFGVVDAEGRFRGVLRREDIDAELDAGRPQTSAADAADADSAATFGVAPDTSLEDLLNSEPLRDLGAVLVVDPDDGHLRGVVSLERVRRAVASAVPA